MPVRIVDDADLIVDKYSRLSATSFIQYQSCPRSWFYQRIQYLRGPQVPAMMRGHIVENTVCRVFRESPILVKKEDSWDVLASPIDENGRPFRSQKSLYKGPTLEPMEGFSDVEELREWTRSRVSVHLPIVMQSHIEEFEDNPMSIGCGDDLDVDLIRSMVLKTIDFHIDEVVRCLNSNGGPKLQEFRKGARVEWPPPDGFPHDWEEPHPSVSEGECTLMEAWEISRPWFVDPDAGTFSLGTVHPEHWFWGEYDFVYDWDGNICIVDLKAAMGDNDRSSGYMLQLEIYAWLWWETHGRELIVDGLQIWYAGSGVIKNIKAPNLDRLFEIQTMLRDTYDELFTNRSTEIDDYPNQPAPLQLFEPGGIHDGEDANPLARCNDCNYHSICPSGDNRLSLPKMEQLEHDGRKWPITKSEELRTRVDICGEVTGLFSPHSDENGGVEVQFNLQQGVDRIKVKNCFFPKPKKITRRISNGLHVRIKNGRPTEWNLVPSIELDNLSEIEIIDAENAEGENIVGLITAGSVVGRVMTIRDTTWQKNRTGSGKPKWRLTISDSSGNIEIVAFAFAITPLMRTIKPGDEIAILNGVYSEFFGRPEIKFQKNTRLVLLKRGLSTT
ncbi:MAG: PD-(D/E)XK nuclease family protein [Candidatus Thermoplasmatota archaeon]|nr:PD-(D/E)XK nuclease family protein [Candidatus Thermoplasmatota archaeon]